MPQVTAPEPPVSPGEERARARPAGNRWAGTGPQPGLQGEGAALSQPPGPIASARRRDLHPLPSSHVSICFPRSCACHIKNFQLPSPGLFIISALEA